MRILFVQKVLRVTYNKSEEADALKGSWSTNEFSVES